MSEIDRAVAFAVLMEHGRGIIDKSPTFVIDKWSLVKDMDKPEELLDAESLHKFILWHNTWLSEPPDR